MTDEKKLRERVYETVTAALGRGYADAADQIADAVCDLVSAEAAPQRTSEAEPDGGICECGQPAKVCGLCTDFLQRPNEARPPISQEDYDRLFEHARELARENAKLRGVPRTEPANAPTEQREIEARPTAREVESEFIEAFAHFIRQAWVGLSRGEADARRSGCISRFTAVKWKFSALRKEGRTPAPDHASWQEKQAEGTLEDDRPGCPHREDVACDGCKLRALMKVGEPLRVRITRNDLHVDGWGTGFCTNAENVEPVEPEPAVVTAEACGDVRVGRVVVRCECGSYREAERPHGFREAEQERAAAAVAAVKELEDAATEREAETHLGTLYDIKRAEERLEKARAVAMEYATKPLYVVSTSTRVGDR